jgi:hypothetical protein
MTKRIDVTGQRFGRLVVVRFAYSRIHAYWHCVCDCGNETIVSRSNLVFGGVVSCGCMRRDTSTRIGHANKTHGHSGYNVSREYKSWQAMHQRCTNPKDPSFKWYGGRGIKVCERWSLFENFLEDMGPRPPGTVLDRINPDGNYELSNCQWGKTGRTPNARKQKH